MRYFTLKAARRPLFSRDEFDSNGGKSRARRSSSYEHELEASVAHRAGVARARILLATQQVRAICLLLLSNDKNLRDREHKTYI